MSMLKCNNVECVLQMAKKKKDGTCGGSKWMQRTAERECHCKICIWVLHQKPR